MVVGRVRYPVSSLLLTRVSAARARPITYIKSTAHGAIPYIKSTADGARCDNNNILRMRCEEGKSYFIANATVMRAVMRALSGLDHPPSRPTSSSWERSCCMQLGIW